MKPTYITPSRYPNYHSRHVPRRPLPTFTAMLLGAFLASCLWLLFIYCETH